MIDGCNPIQTFFLTCSRYSSLPAITVSILNTMWIWNDICFPFGSGNKYRLYRISRQHLQEDTALKDMGALMMLVLAISPIVVFYLSTEIHHQGCGIRSSEGIKY